jgi:hypothetical protein
MEYKTSDIVLASCLKINAYNLSTITVDSFGKGTFVFENVDDNFIQNFDLGKVLVEPVIFNNTIKQLTTSVRRINKGSQV